MAGNLLDGDAGPQPASLFDSKGSWRDQPLNALTELLASPFFAYSSRAQYQLPASHRIRGGSAAVYRTMLGKVVRHLQASQRTLLDAQSADFRRFFEGEMSEASSATKVRYVRLVERIYDHLVRLQFAAENPVSRWLRLEGGAQAVGSVSTGVSHVSIAGPTHNFGDVDTHFAPFIEDSVDAIFDRGDNAPMTLKEDDLFSTPRPVVFGDHRGADLLVSAAKVSLLQSWLHTVGGEALEAGEWKVGRNAVLASLSLGSGMRCAELLRLREDQVKFWPGGPRSERFELEIPSWASVVTARAHRVTANSQCEGLLERWWRARWNRSDSAWSRTGGFGARSLRDSATSSASAAGATKAVKLPDGKHVFPSTLSGKPMSSGALYRGLKALAETALRDGVLDESTRWVLECGAQGLRRAYVLSALEAGADPALLTERLGHWHQRSIRRYPGASRSKNSSFT